MDILQGLNGRFLRFLTEGFVELRKFLEELVLEHDLRKFLLFDCLKSETLKSVPALVHLLKTQVCKRCYLNLLQVALFDQ